MDEAFIAGIVTLIIIGCIGLFALTAIEDTRKCKMEAASKGYNVKEICE